jgi:hypothetical protein
LDAERRRQLKAAGKAEVERRSTKLQEALTASNPAPIGSDEWAQKYKVGLEREKWLLAKLPILDRATLNEMFVIAEDVHAGWVPHPRAYLHCLKCGSAAPSARPRRWFYWASCACGNIRWRSVLFLGRGVIDDTESVETVTLIGKG